MKPIKNTPAVKHSTTSTNKADSRSEQKIQKLTKRLDRYATLMDSSFKIPGTRIRFGWDAIIGLIPGLGDGASLLLSSIILIESQKIGAPKSLIWKMGRNLVIEFFIGSIPLIGDVFDIYWKANIRNMALLKTHLNSQTDSQPPSSTPQTQAKKITVLHLTLALITVILIAATVHIFSGTF